MMLLRASRPFSVTGRFVLFCLVGFFLTVAAVNAVMVRFAVSTFGGVETESAYKAGLAFRAEIDASVAQATRSWKVDARIAEAREDPVIHVVVRDQAGHPVPRLAARIQLEHPADRRRDIAVPAAEQSAGTFRAVAGNASGQRNLVIELSRDGERVFRSVNRVVIP
jgi:nitrogen fixation protein FixH